MKKFFFSILVLLCMFVLSGCGASVTSKTKFDQEGGGTRTITAVISASDAKNLKNGFDELDVLLRDAAPEGITVHRTNLSNGDAQYHFSIQFQNIQDYNNKISAITGTSHNATWYNTTNVFQSNVEFSEEDCTYELIAWAIDAFKNSDYSAFSNYFRLYEVSKNEFYFGEQLVYSGTGDPHFTLETSPKLKKVNVYTDFTYETQTKKVELLFDKGSLDRIDLEAAKSALMAYSDKVKIDTANCTVTYELSNIEEIKDFLLSADLRNKEEDIDYLFVNNPFQKKYILKENYYLSELLNTFAMEDTNVYYYVKLPEVTDDTKFSQAGQSIESPGQYQYATSVYKDYGYTMDASMNHLVDLKDINVYYEVTNDLSCKRSIEISYIKNNCSITESELNQYFPDVTDKISFFDAGDTIRLVFVSLQRKENGLLHGFGVEKLSGHNLKYVHHALEENLDLSRYLPVLEGYQWNLNLIKYNYEVTIEEDTGLYDITAGPNVYTTDTLNQIKSTQGYVVKGSDTADHMLTMEVCFRNVYHMFYFWIIFIIFMIVVAVLGFTLYYTKKKSAHTEETIEEL